MEPLIEVLPTHWLVDVKDLEYAKAANKRGAFADVALGTQPVLSQHGESWFHVFARTTSFDRNTDTQEPLPLDSYVWARWRGATFTSLQARLQAGNRVFMISPDGRMWEILAAGYDEFMRLLVRLIYAGQRTDLN